MITIIGVRFRNVGKVYYFSPRELDICVGDHVIVETARGVEYGFVVLGPKEVDDSKVIQPLKEVIRIATPKDDAREESNRKKEKEAFEICQKKIRAHNLEMKLIDAEYTFDNNKMLFYFTADGRIDFRELVKDLASVFRTRIELRQIGVRDETKLLGGMAICGRPLCCHTFLSEFAPVSIKMAKEQGLSLNPTQISGVCGRLMCCLKNEQEAYEELNHSLPSIGSQVKTIDGYTGEVQSTSVLKQLVKIVITKKNGEREIREYPVADLSFKDHQISNEGSELEASLNEMVDAEGLEQLEIMEKQDMEELQEQEEETGKSGGKRENNRRSRGQRRDGRDRNRDRNQNRDNRGQNRDDQNRENRGQNKDSRDQNRSRDNRRDRDSQHNNREKRPARSRGGYENQNIHLPETEKQEQSFRGGYERQNDGRREKGRPERFREERSRKSERENFHGRRNNNNRRQDNNTKGQNGPSSRQNH